MIKRRYFYFIMMILTMVMIFIFSSQNGVKSSNVSEKVADTIHIEQQVDTVKKSAQPLALGFSLRKYAHITLYFILGTFTFLFMAEYRLNILWTVLVCFIYSLSDEFHQYFIPGRDAAFKDVLIDALGYAIAIALCIIIRKFMAKEKQRK